MDQAQLDASVTCRGRLRGKGATLRASYVANDDQEQRYSRPEQGLRAAAPSSLAQKEEARSADEGGGLEAKGGGGSSSLCPSLSDSLQRLLPQSHLYTGSPASRCCEGSFSIPSVPPSLRALSLVFSHLLCTSAPSGRARCGEPGPVRAENSRFIVVWSRGEHWGLEPWGLRSRCFGRDDYPSLSVNRHFVLACTLNLPSWVGGWPVFL